ncbi:hypothetical protein T4A_548 [Trichinella pseudospiralis]|uniref:Uncharacterized protein n=1 Tax=Trichinella pseudospiralis TaxID=6337 RepID=A0A0V1AQ59_TRIPS|nr:hypothetical protein T4A_548 [Trichinella pseudospiralis]
MFLKENAPYSPFTSGNGLNELNELTACNIPSTHQAIA